MRIAIVSQGFGYGGSYIAAANVGKALAAEGNDLYYFAYQYTANYSNLPQDRLFQFGLPHKGMRAAADKVAKGMEFFIRRNFVPADFAKAERKRLIAYLDEYKIDIVILNSFWSVTLFAEALRNDRPNLKTIGWMHEATDYSFGSLTKNYRPAFKKALAAVSAIVCLTHFDFKVFSEYNNKVKVIYNPVVLTKHGLSPLTSRSIIFTTRLDTYIKGLDYLVDLADQLPEGWKIQIAGQGHPDQVKEFQNMISKVSPNKLNFIGALKGAALAKHYQSGSMFISTSRTEGLGMVIIEAMSFGLPIISFAHNGGREILEADQTGLLVPIGDVQGMLDKINLLINDIALRREYGEKSLQRYEAFKMPQIILQWNDLLSSLSDDQ